MPHYYFDKCPETCVAQLEELACELRLETLEAIEHQIKLWRGNIFERIEDFDRRITLRYSSNNFLPLMLQIYGETNHKEPDVK